MMVNFGSIAGRELWVNGVRVSSDTRSAPPKAKACDGKTMDMDYATVHGNNNRVKGDYNKIIGKGNVISGDYNEIIGDNCVVKGDYNKITGNGCTVTGDFNNPVIGDGNTVSGDYNCLFGERCKILRGDSCELNGTQIETRPARRGSVRDSSMSIGGMMVTGTGDIVMNGSGTWINGSRMEDAIKTREQIEREVREEMKAVAMVEASEKNNPNCASPMMSRAWKHLMAQRTRNCVKSVFQIWVR